MGECMQFLEYSANAAPLNCSALAIAARLNCSHLRKKQIMTTYLNIPSEVPIIVPLPEDLRLRLESPRQRQPLAADDLTKMTERAQAVSAKENPRPCAAALLHSSLACSHARRSVPRTSTPSRSVRRATFSGPRRPPPASCGWRRHRRARLLSASRQLRAERRSARPRYRRSVSLSRRAAPSSRPPSRRRVARAISTACARALRRRSVPSWRSRHGTR